MTIDKSYKTMKKTIYIAGGCFWGAERFFKLIEGVTKTKVGYANSRKASPTYKEVCSGTTDAVECVEVTYDPETAPLRFIIDLYFKIIDPTSIDRQGEDRGRQYRTGIYYTDPADEQPVKEEVALLAKNYSKPVVVEIMPLDNFYDAEEYHQDYLEKNPTGYCHVPQELFILARQAKAKK